ncbi:uncharacterized protein STEHIDRAFT_154640 [Stereum hirsutum FP-91666 SS1]|uniref:uncharacterized protein n=1 Tax=Stereum hirsutum (strain FP-91666) TaxID=721885 RepID=UPI000440EB6A|nr:uncharacterized protein STEHIDRAFT_154640 [Stereum hirsutum FP-91666 SS1]EIM88933.1 hypothetical protein STEHIDRAFT_154640 [Stereum hirsutum FP-91666 SS1]
MSENIRFLWVTYSWVSAQVYCLISRLSSHRGPGLHLSGAQSFADGIAPTISGQLNYNNPEAILNVVSDTLPATVSKCPLHQLLADTILWYYTLTDCPLISWYFTFSLDLSASVNHLEDSEATAAAQMLKAGTYSPDFPLPSRPFTRLSIRLVSQGLPTEDDLQQHYVKPHMCVPIAPNTEHPTGREAMIPFKPLPWPNLHFHTAMFTHLRAPSDPKNFSAAMVASLPDLRRMRRCWNDDEAERQALSQAASHTERSSVKDHYPLPFCGPFAHETLAPVEDVDEDDDGVYPSLDDGLGEGTTFENDADFAKNMFMRAILDGDDPVHESIPIIRNVEYDLSKIEHFDDPGCCSRRLEPSKSASSLSFGYIVTPSLYTFNL